MLLYTSTRKDSTYISADEAILRGLAPDGGLYAPQYFSKIDVEQLAGMARARLWAEVLSKLLGGYAADELENIVSTGYKGKFPEIIAPLINTGDINVLELFHGPTSAFKDIALCLLPLFMARAAKKLGIDEKILVLAATSGDTGKAALEGFRDAQGALVAVFYPHGGVSRAQYLQMATQRGENARVCAVLGNFDDAQTGVKRIFADAELNDYLRARGYRLSSANSINLGRLAPQVAYYFAAYLDMVARGMDMGEKLNFCVPTGNFGDILAGEYARQMGLPVGKLICASNENNILTDFINTGVYDARRPLLKTDSPSMDILISSNLERCLHLLSGGDCALVDNMMARLRADGAYTAPELLTRAFKRDFYAANATGDEAAAEIAREFRETGYALDPHTAVGAAVMRKYAEATGDETQCVLLSTASPFKFSPAVLRALGITPPEDEFECMRALSDLINVDIPAPLAELEILPVLHNDIVEKTDMGEYVKNIAAARA